VLPLEGRLLDGKFRFTKLLGAGGMGAVWRAQNIRVKKAVAIKLMHAEFAGNPGILERFKAEATAAGTIGNAHICDIYDFGTSVLGPYIVLEMLNGRSLGELVQQQGRVDPGLAVLIIRQALIGLGAAHAAGIVHRDLKPENIFLHEPSPGHLLVKLMDFGISKFSQGGSEGRTSAGVLMGTPEYMSPEQTEGAAGVDHRTDIWAMGAILYKALTGADAFTGPSMAAILVAVSTKPHVPISQIAPHVPPGLIAVVDKCLCKDPNGRYQSCAELSAALAPFEQVGGSLPAMASHTHVPSLTGAPVTNAPVMPPAAPQATVITGGPPPGGAPPAPQATVITGGPPPSGPQAAPQATVITGGPPLGGPSLGGPPPGEAKATWSGEIARGPAPDESWSLGSVAPPTVAPVANTGGGGKGLTIALALLLLAGGGGAAVFLMGGKAAEPGPAVAATAGTPEAKVETPEPAGASAGDTKAGDTAGAGGATAGDTKAGDTAGAAGATAGDTKAGDTGATPSGDTAGAGDTKAGGDTKTEDDKKGDDAKKTTTTTKPKELVFEIEFDGRRLPGKMLWEKAKSYCDGLAIGSLKSWRLPKASELLKERKNAKLAGRKFWTSESSAGKVKVVDMASGSTEELPGNTPKIDVVCVTLK
ncbi:MAG TPA: serine/threonine-protein kinase, partial [Nannocystis sp.]